MTTEEYLSIYNYLVFDRRIDTDEAECILSDIEDMMTSDTDCWELVEELI